MISATFVQDVGPQMKTGFDLQELVLRTLIVIAGGVAATLLVLHGEGQALPALAVGGTLGAFFVARLGATTKE